METLEITDIDIKWLIECDNISLSTTGFSVGTVVSESSRVSFNDVPEVFNFEKNSNSNFHAS